MITEGLAPSLLARLGEPYERRAVHVDGGEIAYAQAGEGEHAVVLIHGTLTSLDDMLLPLTDHLPGRRLIALDRPGLGTSQRQGLGQAGILRQARILNQALAHLDVGKAVLVGHSFGAAVALAMALEEPERFAGLVALSPLVVPEWRLEHLLFGPRGAPIFGGWLAGWSHEGLDAALLPLLWRAMFLPQPMPKAVERCFPFAMAGEAGATRRVGEDCLAAGPDLLALLARAPGLAIPMHVLCGSADVVANPLVHGALLARLAPRANFDLLPGVGHMVHHAAPDAVARAVGGLASGRPGVSRASDMGSPRPAWSLGS
ncbi:alpha/beta hydrolase [Caulobacter flavus]|uniref:Alpha/beta hydrolase n=1 Tax=Caulobacter flavus TaxID=1679497 RepID=A0A2N5CP27_9CAUL|nr:alpha/beta hydrolase [Caulobacter flavus]AYV48570.1 alpha/beta hydrolase [Caulobacter flavus]PLR08713.1 alpha/beta hydrolase [Caulobacter flavus]